MEERGGSGGGRRGGERGEERRKRRKEERRGEKREKRRGRNIRILTHLMSSRGRRAGLNQPVLCIQRHFPILETQSQILSQGTYYFFQYGPYRRRKGGRKGDEREDGRIYFFKKNPCAVRPLEVFACITMGQPTGGRGCKWQGGRKWWRRNLSSDATLISTIR